MLLTPSPLVWCSISWIWGSSAIKPWSWKELTAMHLVCVMWCCGVSELHICHVVLAEASITNSVSAAIDKSVLRPENWDMSKQMLWRNGTPSQRYPVLIPASLFFASTRGAWPCLLPAKILMLACSVEKWVLLRAASVHLKQHVWDLHLIPCICPFCPSVYTEACKSKKKVASFYLHQAARTRHPLGIPKTHFP